MKKRFVFENNYLFKQHMRTCLTKKVASFRIEITFYNVFEKNLKFKKLEIKKKV